MPKKLREKVKATETSNPPKVNLKTIKSPSVSIKTNHEKLLKGRKPIDE